MADWNNLVEINISQSAAIPVGRDFGIALEGVELATNSLNGDRVRTYETVQDASADKTAGYISAATYDGIVAALGQPTPPAKVKVGNVDRVLVAALRSVWGGDFKWDATLTAVVPGQDGNLITLALVSDTAETIAVVGNAITVHFHAGVSTVTSIKALIAGNIAAAALVTPSAGTGATVLIGPSAFTALPLLGGSGETWSEGYVAWDAADPDFYGVGISSRDQDDQLGIATTIAADKTRRLFIAQSSSATLETATPDADYTEMAGLSRGAGVWHDTDSVWADFAWLGNRLPADLDVTSAPWNASLSDVAPYAVTMTAAKRDFVAGNDWNAVLKFGTAVSYVAKGVDWAGRQISQTVTNDWFEDRLRTRITNLILSRSASFQKIPLDKDGQNLVVAEVAAVLSQGSSGSSPHFVPNSWAVTPLTITPADKALGRMRIQVTGLYAVNAVEFVFTVNFTD